jgi:hypothetical protein
MGAAEDQGLGAPFEQGCEVMAGDLIGHRMVAPALLGKWYEKGARQGANLYRRAETCERRLVRGRADGALGSDDADPFGAG